MTRHRLALCAAAVLAVSTPAYAQGGATPGGANISGTVAGSNGSRLPFGTASILETGAERFSNDRGEFSLGNLASGSYHLRVRQLGFARFDTVLTVLPGQPPIQLHVVLSPVAMKLATVTVRERTRCTVPPEGDIVEASNLGTILEELRKNADRERLLTISYPFAYRLIDSFEPQIAPLRLGPDTVSYRSDDRPRYFPGGLVCPNERSYPRSAKLVIPVLGDLGDPNFLRSHCFEYHGKEKERRLATHRIDFRPTADISGPDVEGSVFLDSDSFVIRRAVFRLTNPSLLDPPVNGLEITTIYREILPGVTVVGDVESIQTIPESGAYSPGMKRLTERLRLLDFRFLKSEPGDKVR